MPKHYLYPDPTRAGEDAAQTGRLELHWQRDNYVQLASTRWAGDGAPDTAAEFLPGTSTNVSKLAWDGQFIDLNRDQINHLIKQLRAARDQAYGRDE